MKLDKAIELSPEIENSLRSHKFTDFADAVALGREALKRFKRSKPYGYAHPRDLLPGETEE